MDSPGKPVSSTSETPLFRNLSAVMALVVLVVLVASGAFLIHRQKSLLYQEQLRSGEFVLHYLVRATPIPLLEDDALSLNTIVKQAMVTDSVAYVTIVDNTGVIKAHTDLAKIGTAFKDIATQGGTSEPGNMDRPIAALPSDEATTDISMPISFMNKTIGTAHLGLSNDFINRLIQEQTTSFAREISYLGLFTILIVIGASLFFKKRSYRQTTQSISPLQQKPQDTLSPEIRRNQVTVLYAGIKGFKEYANDRDPEDVFRELNEYYAIASHRILEFGGFIDKFAGDAIIGVFGDSPFTADHTQRAVWSAVAIQRAVKANGGNGNRLPCKVGIGISSGVALCGLIGSGIRKEYTFIGESFENAYSLYLMAGPGEIVISKDVYQSIETSASVDPVPPLEMVKKTESWKHFRLKKILPGKT